MSGQKLYFRTISSRLPDTEECPRHTSDILVPFAGSERRLFNTAPVAPTKKGSGSCPELEVVVRNQTVFWFTTA